MKATRKKIPAIIALFLFLVTAAFASAAPVQVEADRMESASGENLVRFSGHVEARQEGLVIRAAEMDVHYRKAAGGEKREKAAVDRIVARGGVTLIREGWVATGRELDYAPERSTAVLTGDVQVRQGSNLVSGERIVLDLKSGRTVVERGESGGKRVRAFFYPDSGEEK